MNVLGVALAGVTAFVIWAALVVGFWVLVAYCIWHFALGK